MKTPIPPGTDHIRARSIGLEILREKNQFKVREGFKPGKLRIPGRVFETASPLGKVDERYIRESMAEFYKLLNAN